jgi:hypothetical protein
MINDIKYDELKNMAEKYFQKCFNKIVMIQK